MNSAIIVIFDLFYGKWISYRLLILRLFYQTPCYVYLLIERTLSAFFRQLSIGYAICECVVVAFT